MLRLALSLLAALVLAIALLALWGYYRLDSLLAAQARLLLLGQGVQEVQIDGARLTLTRALLASITVSGEREGRAFSMTAAPVTLGFTLATLRERRLDSLDVEALDITLQQHGRASESGGGATDVAALLAALNPGALPLARARIDSLHIDYVAPLGGTVLDVKYDFSDPLSPHQRITDSAPPARH